MNLQDEYTRRGLPHELVAEMGLLPLDDPAAAAFPKCYPPCGEGFLIPYHNVDTPYARRRNMSTPLPVNHDGAEAKYSSPFNEPSHLYWVRFDAAKINSSKAMNCYVEGEIKTAVLSYYIRSLDTDALKFIVIGGGGVDNFRGAPEFRTLPAKDRKHLIFFDADAETNAQVRCAAYRLSMALIRRGASFKNIRVVRWDMARGKGIDDYLLSFPPDERSKRLALLINEAKPLMTAYPLDIESAVWSMAGANLAESHKSMIAEALIKQYKKEGVKKTDIEKMLTRAIGRKEKAAQKLGDIDPDAPKGEASRAAELIQTLVKDLQFDVIHDKVVANGMPMNDQLAASLYVRLVDIGIKTKGVCDSVLTSMAAKRPVHPIKEYLEATEWDGKDHIERLSSCYEDKFSVFSLYLRRWLVGAVRKIYVANSQNPVIVLIGDQGEGKGHLARWLCSGLGDDYFVEANIKPRDKDNMIRLSERFIWEASEFGTTMKASDQDDLKQFFTLPTVVIRRPYGHFEQTKPAVSSFIGTINNDGVGFLTDMTGNRRYRPISLTAVHRNKFNTLRIPVNQVWAQAVALFRAGETADLTSEEETRIRDEILPHYMQESILEELLRETIELTENYSDRLTSMQLLQAIEEHGYKRRNDTVDGIEITKILNKWGRNKTKSGGTMGYRGIRIKRNTVTKKRQGE